MLVHLSSQTASSSTSLTFTNIYSTVNNKYRSLEFHFHNIQPATAYVDFTFQVKDIYASTFGKQITSTVFTASIGETVSSGGLSYQTTKDQEISTSYQTLAMNLGADYDETCAGILRFGNPMHYSSRKNFTSRINAHSQDSSNSVQYTYDNYVGGSFSGWYLDEIDFKMSSGNIAGGKIIMYGVKQ